MRYRFGTLLLISEQRVLFDGETRVPLAPKTFDILELLLENAGTVVNRETLRHRVWGGAHVDEAVVSRNVSLVRIKLRPFFGDTEVIETISKRGYRVVVPVEAIAASPEDVERPGIRAQEQLSEADAAFLDSAADPAAGDAAAGLAPNPVPARVPAQIPAHATDSAASAAKLRNPAVRWALAGAVAALVLLAAFGFSFYRSEHVHAQQNELAVVDLRDLSGTPDASWMGVALEESLAQAISRDGGMTALDGDQVAVAEEDLGLSHARRFDPAELDQLDRRLGVNYVLTGTYMPVGEQVRIDLVLHKGDKVLNEFSETVEQRDLQAAIERASARMRTSLHLPQAHTGGELQFFGPNELAAHFYAEGLRLSRTGDTPRPAREAFSKAVAADPQFAEAHEALAKAWSKVGHAAESRAEAQLALDTCAALPETRRLSVQAAAYQQLRNYPRALDAITQLRKLHPDDQSYKLRMAQALLASNKLPEATVLLREMEADKAHPPNLEAMTALMRLLAGQGDKKAQFLYSDKIMKLARAEGSRSAEALAHMFAGRGWNAVGDGPKAVAEFQKAGELYGEIGDTTGGTLALQNESATRIRLHMPGGIAVGQQALERAAEAGQDGTVAEQCINLGQAALDASQLRSAISYDKRARELGVVIASKHMEQIAMQALVDASLLSEQLPEAEKEDAEELQYARQVGSPVEVAGATGQLAEIDSYLGRWDQAEAKYREALAILQKAGSAADANELLVDYSWMLLERGDVAQARQVFAKVDRVTLEDNVTLADMEEARLAFAWGDPGKAEELVSAALAKNRIPYKAAPGLDLLMQVATKQKDAAKARAVAARYSELAQSIPEDGLVQRGAVRTQAQAELLAGDRAGDAVRKLPDVLRQATALQHASEVAELKALLAPAK